MINNKEKQAIQLLLTNIGLYFFKIYNLKKIILPNLIFNIIRKLICFQNYKKKKIELILSYKTDKLLNHYFNNNEIDFFSLRESFFNEPFFSYNRKSDKKKNIIHLKTLNSNAISYYIRCADNILNNEFRIFQENYKFKNNINWHYSFFDNYSYDIIPSKEINIRPKYKNKFIDVKFVWEFNRHQFLSFLGLAYYLTSKEKYAVKFKDLILDWIKKNPPLYGINWKSGLEISIRLINWILSLWFFKDSETVNNTFFFKKILKSLFQHAFYLKYFYTRYSFNHTVGEIFGVYFFSRIFKNINIFRKWEKKFFKKFRKQIFLQTRSDGINIEQSINYHRFVLEFFIFFLFLNRKRMEYFEIQRIEKMFDFLLYSIKPNGKFPNIGDNDDGSLLLFNSQQANKFTFLINLGSILFKRGDLKYIHNKYTILALLWFGYKGYSTFNSLDYNEPEYKFKIFEKTGFISIRDSWSKDSSFVFLDYGKFGPLHSPHSHSDITNIILSIDGIDILIDSGTYSYHISESERILFRSSKSHNILNINSKNQAQIVSTFIWKDKPKLKRYVKKIDKNFHFICYHNGYKKYLIKREVIIEEKFKEITIIDLVFPKKKEKKNRIINFNILFHFNSDIKIKLKNDIIVINDNLIMQFYSKKEFHLSIVDTFFSPKYGVKLPNKTLEIKIKGSKLNNEKTKFISKIKNL